MTLDLSATRPVSCRDPLLTLGQIFEEAKSPQGLILIWANKDHRLLRTCKVLRKHNIFVKHVGELGMTRYRLNPNWQGQLT